MNDRRRTREVKTYLSDREIDRAIRRSVSNPERVKMDNPRSGLATYVREIALQAARSRLQRRG